MTYYAFAGNTSLVEDPQRGMTLRDYFAAQALALISSRSWDHLIGDEAKIRAWAVAAYAVADEMMKVRVSE